ncbi:unnamed protein product [marine sediment metagenome]|uniref:Uncharacterized protein n=1 Tax=marine sediment metagenome TaxID=412755 RepID=X0VZB7_9ZZZZ
MVTVSITTDGEYSDALYKTRDDIIGFSITGSWTGTIELQRKADENTLNYPLHSDTGWTTFLSKTAIFNADSYHLAPGWFRIIATNTITGTAVCRIW